MPNRLPRTGDATLSLTVSENGRWSARMSVRAPGTGWRSISNAWLEFGTVPKAPETLREVELMMLAVLCARYPEEVTRG